MTSLADAIHAVAAADTGAGNFVAQMANGASGILGNDAGAQPPAALAPWAILVLDTDAESFAPNAVDAAFEWWIYDYEHMGYGRINTAAGRLLRLYPEQTGGLYRDTVTGELIWWQGMGSVGRESAAPEYRQLVRVVRWPCRKTHRGTGS